MFAHLCKKRIFIGSNLKKILKYIKSIILKNLKLRYYSPPFKMYYHAFLTLLNLSDQNANFWMSQISCEIFFAGFNMLSSILFIELECISNRDNLRHKRSDFTPNFYGLWKGIFSWTFILLGERGGG